MSEHPGGCLCDGCCERARSASPQYEQQYGLYAIGYKGNGLGKLGITPDKAPPSLWHRTLFGHKQ